MDAVPFILVSAPRRLAVLSLLLVLVTSGAEAACRIAQWPTEQQLPLPLRPSRLVAADVNGDRLLDAVMIDATEALISMRNADRSLGAVTVFHESTTTLGDLAVVDADGDTDVDLILSERFANRLLLLRNAGDGTFAAAEAIAVAGAPSGLAAGDFNGDGKTDIAYVATDAATNAVVIVAGSGTGLFSELRRLPLAKTPYAISARDLDGDGSLDVIASERDFTRISLFFGNGDGTFDPVQELSGGAIRPYVFETADLDADGDLDLAAGHFENQGTISVFRNDGNRTFDPAVYRASFPSFLGSVTSISDLDFADVNGDQHLDLLAVAANPGGVAVFNGRGDGTLEPGGIIVTGWPFMARATPWNGFLDHIDGDARIDLVVVAGSNLVAFRNRCGESKMTAAAIHPVLSAGDPAVIRAEPHGLGQPFFPPRGGTITISQGWMVLASRPVEEGTDFTITGLAAGDQSLTVHYSGDENLAPAETTVVQRVIRERTSMTLVSSTGSTSEYGQTVTLTASVTPREGSTASGSVHFVIDGVRDSFASSTKTRTLQSLRVGQHTFAIEYSGDAVNPPNRISVPHEVVRAKTTLLPSIPRVWGAGSPVPGAASVTAAHGGTPSGTVTLSAGGVVIGSGPLTGFSPPSARVPFSGLAPGRHDITITYSGDASFLPSAATATHTVIADTSVVLDARWSDPAIVLSYSTSVPHNAAITRCYRDDGTGWQELQKGVFFGCADSNVVRGRAYRYKIELYDDDNVFRGRSTDAVVAGSFRDPLPIVAGTIVRAHHFSELRDAANALRTLARIPPVNLANDAIVRAEDLVRIREAIDEARFFLGAWRMPFNDAIVPGRTVIRAIHFQELRDLVR